MSDNKVDNKCDDDQIDEIHQIHCIINIVIINIAIYYRMPSFNKRNKNKDKNTTSEELPSPTSEIAQSASPADDAIITHDKEIADIINTLIVRVSSIIESDLKIQSGDAVILVSRIMELVEKLNDSRVVITSRDKAYITMMVSCKVVDMIHALSDEEKTDFKQLIPSIIEIVIKATKNDITIDSKLPMRTDTKVDTVPHQKII